MHTAASVAKLGFKSRCPHSLDRLPVRPLGLLRVLSDDGRDVYYHAQNLAGRGLLRRERGRRMALLPDMSRDVLTIRIGAEESINPSDATQAG